jgi:hypothetical protein
MYQELLVWSPPKIEGTTGVCWIQSIDSNPYTVFEILWPQQMSHAYLHAHLHGKWHTHLHGMAISTIRQYYSIFDIQAIHAQTH